MIGTEITQTKTKVQTHTKGKEDWKEKRRDGIMNGDEYVSTQYVRYRQYTVYRNRKKKRKIEGERESEK